MVHTVIQFLFALLLIGAGFPKIQSLQPPQELHQVEYQLVATVGTKSFYTNWDLRRGDLASYTFFCQRNGLFIATIDTEEELEAVHTFFHTPTIPLSPYWVGVVDWNTEGTFYWLRNFQPVTPAPWWTITNRNMTQYNCAYIYNREMLDVPCTTEWHYLCEYP